jgi:hypothetical protein
MLYICMKYIHMRTILFLICLLLTSSATLAEVIETPRKLVLSQPKQTIDLDVDENGVVDFEFFYDVFENEPFLHINVPDYRSRRRRKWRGRF